MFSTLIGAAAATKIGKGVKRLFEIFGIGALAIIIWRWYKGHRMSRMAMYPLLLILIVMAWWLDSKTVLLISGTFFLASLFFDLAQLFGVNLNLFVPVKKSGEGEGEPSKRARRRKTSAPAKPEPAKKSAAGQVSVKSTGERKTSVPAKPAPAKKSTPGKVSIKSTAEKKTPATAARKPVKKSFWEKIAHPFSSKKD